MDLGMAAFYFVVWKEDLDEKEDMKQKKQLIMDKTKAGIAGLMQGIKAKF